MEPDYDISTLPEIAVSKPVPYRRNQTCPKCGNRERRGMLWGLLDRVNVMHRAYCMGSKPATISIPGPDGKMIEAPTVCAGLEREHMHLHCPHCKYNFMCEVKIRA